MQVLLEDNVPLPNRAVSAVEEFQFDDMKIKQSFAVSDDKALKRARNAAYLYKKKNPGWNYTAERYADGSGRLWRIS